jgi:L-threonylcarbamoyladenylate synthase
LGAAARVIAAGGIVAYPTEAVWGLGCAPLDRPAVARLRDLKQRDPAKGLILVAGDMAQLRPWLRGLSPQNYQILAESWPGPNTWLVPCPRPMPWLTGRFHTIALRVTAHPLVVELCRRVGGPVVSTSANPEGRPPARTAAQVRRYFHNRVDYVLLGRTLGAENPSVIQDLVTGEVVRPA